jgi:sugar phosphate isomerase/epimerase
MLSFSTCWNSGRHQDGEAMLQEILDLGFERVELGHGVRLTLMEGIQRRFNKGGFTISSLHNFCPLPIEITRAAPDCYQFSSADARERERAVRHTFQTIDFAQRFNAQIVVLHLGRAPIGEYTDKLVEMAGNGLINSRTFVREKMDCVRKREEKVPPFFQRSRECLARIVEYAQGKGVQLGIESRHSYEEIPNEREMATVLNEFNVPEVGYWHDFGHVQVKHNLGFLDHREWLSQAAPRLIGCHLHDTKWPGRDHLAPFTGDIDYDQLIPLLPEDTLFVFEMSPRRTREEIIEAREKWSSKYGA